jgi:uncharacterized protein (DUF3084 family)
MAADRHEALIRAYIDEVFNWHRVDTPEAKSRHTISPESRSLLAATRRVSRLINASIC